ncbi:hypothetical protein GCM10027417_03760 [Glutamicibacter endophyticus]
MFPSYVVERDEYADTRSDVAACEQLLGAVDRLEELRSAAATDALARVTAEMTQLVAAESFVLAFYASDLSDSTLKGYVGVVLDCSQASERHSLSMASIGRR